MTPASSALILGRDGQTAAYLARLLDARGLAVAATDVGTGMRMLGVADAVGGVAPEAAPEQARDIDLVFAIDDGTAATDALIAAVLPELGRDTRLVHVVEAATLADRPVARARMRDLAVARSEAGGRFVNLLLQRHDSRLGPADSLPARVVEHARAVARGEAGHRLTLAETGALDWGWTADHVDAVARAATMDRPRDVIVATGHGLTVAAMAAAAARHFRIDAEAAFAVTGAGVATEDFGTAVAATRAATGWSATTWGDDFIKALCEAERVPVG